MVEYAPRAIDPSYITGLGRLATDWRENFNASKRDASLARLAAEGALDPNSVGLALLSSGDAQGGLQALHLANTVAQQNRAQANTDRAFGFQQTESQRAQGNTDRGFGFQEREAGRAQANAEAGRALQERMQTRQEEPEIVRRARASGLREGTPEYNRFVQTGPSGQRLTPTEQQAIFHAEDAIPAVDATIQRLGRALELNPRIFTGGGSGVRTAIGNAIPGVSNLLTDEYTNTRARAEAAGLRFGTPEFNRYIEQNEPTAAASREWGNLMSQESITAMSSALRGVQTDRDMAAFQRIIADPSTPENVRRDQIQRMLQLAQRQREIAQARVSELRGQTYFNPGRGQPAAGPPPAAAAPQAAQPPAAAPSAAPQAAQAPQWTQEEIQAEIRRRGLAQ